MRKNVQLAHWQFVQIVDTMRLLFTFALKKNWAHDFDWEYSKLSAKPLENNHTTVAQHHADFFKGMELADGTERCSNELYERYSHLKRASHAVLG